MAYGGAKEGGCFDFDIVGVTSSDLEREAISDHPTIKDYREAFIGANSQAYLVASIVDGCKDLLVVLWVGGNHSEVICITFDFVRKGPPSVRLWGAH